MPSAAVVIGTLRVKQGFPLGLFNEGCRDSLCGVKGSDYDSGVCCFKEVKITAKTLIILAF